MNKELIRRAQKLGINYSMLYLLPPKKRDKALAEEIKRAESQLVLVKMRVE